MQSNKLFCRSNSKWRPLTACGNISFHTRTVHRLINMAGKQGVINELSKKVPFRQKQISTLLNLFGTTEDKCCCPCIFIYGHIATGKTLVLDAIFEQLELPNIVINCVECFNIRLIFEFILNQLRVLYADFQDYIRCENTNEFIHIYKKILSTSQTYNAETIFIVFEKCERLRDLDSSILLGLSRLSELTQSKVCVIFVSELIYHKFQHGTGMRQPYIIHFPEYLKPELLQIMSLDAPVDHPKEFYHGYCQLLLSVFYNVCRDLRELRHLAKLNFPKYCNPVITGEATYTDVRKLWRNIEPHLKKALNTVFLHEVSSTQWEQIENDYHGLKGLSSYSTVELPFYSKYLLIAAYLASYNPAKTDRQFFCKTTQKKMSKRSKVAAKTATKDNNQLKGPHMFVLDRLMAIFYSIVDEKVPASASILSQLSSLVTLRFLSQVSSGDQLDTPKYKCLVSLEFIRVIARQLEFDLGHYLYDLIN